MGKKSIYGSGMKSSGHISKSLEAVFWAKIPKFLICIRIWNLFDPGSGIQKEKNRIRDKHSGSAIL
jgi:hypothetical protein